MAVEPAIFISPIVALPQSSPLSWVCIMSLVATFLLTILVEQLALQQQIEMLQAQQQQIFVQHQQIAQAGLLPGQSTMISQPSLMPPPQLQPTFMTPTGAFGQFQAPPPIPGTSHRRAQSSSHQYSNSQSSVGGNTQDTRPTNSSPGQGHVRRHSLALSEAKKAAALAQAKRTGAGGEGSPNSPSGSSPNSNSSPSGENPSFNFPATPEQGDESGSPSRQYGKTYRATSPTRSFQFPASGPSPAGDQDYRSHQHNRSNSRNFEGNWRQPAPQHQTPPPPQLQQQPSQEFLSPAGSFVPGHRSRGSYNSSVSSIQAFGLMPPHNQYQVGNQQQQQQQQRKSLFAPYLPQGNLPSLLAEGRLVSGILRVNKKNRSDAYVSTDGLLDADIFICGSKDRNRALEGDLVAIELLEVNEVWGSKKEKEEKKKRKDATINSVEDNRGEGLGSGLRRRGSLKQRPTQKKNDDVEVEGQSLLLVEEEALTDEIKPLYAGHVVAVIDRIAGQMFSGTLGLLRPSSQATKDKQEAERKDKGDTYSRPHNDRPKIVWFKPTDKRVPLIAIPTEQAPKDFVDNHEKYADRIFVASIKRWPITSLHPFGTLVEQLGSRNNVEIEIDAILRDNNFGSDVFSENSLSYVPDTNQLPGEATNGRRDFASEYVIAFSPKENLVEEAIHIKKISDDKVELGIHIVDASYYLKKNSALDREASKRGTSVFLKQRTCNMLPDKFNENVSFRTDGESLALSVVFEVDPKTFKIESTWIGESIVTPRQTISYNDMQSILTGTAVIGISQAEIDYITTLQLVSNMFRKQRIGLLGKGNELPLLGLLNFVDDEPINVSANIFESSLVQDVFDEVNIKVNSAVAAKLHQELGSRAFLRRHSDPIHHKLESFIESVKNLNIQIDTTSSATIQKCILETKDEAIRKGIEALLYKCMNRARYFVAGKAEPETKGHYFLNVPLYTHFNAPLRRYADLVVHRQLRAIITGNIEEYEDDADSLASLADTLNFKKDCAKNAQEQSIHLAVCQDIDKRTVATGQLVIDSIIIQVYESAFDVLIPEYGIEKRVHGDQLPLRKAEFEKKTRLLELFWEGGVDSATYVPDDEKNVKPGRSGSIRKGRVRASSAASALAQGQALDQIAKLSLNTDTPSVEDTSGLSSSYSESHQVLAPFFENVVTRVDNKTGERVQEIRVLQHVPVLLSAELGSNIPCLTVRALNPFTK